MLYKVSCNCGSVGRLTVHDWNRSQLNSCWNTTEFSKSLDSLLECHFLLFKILDFERIFSTEMKYEQLEEQEGKYFSDFANWKTEMQEH